MQHVSKYFAKSLTIHSSCSKLKPKVHWYLSIVNTMMIKPFQHFAESRLLQSKVSLVDQLKFCQRAKKKILSMKLSDTSEFNVFSKTLKFKGQLISL